MNRGQLKRLRKELDRLRKVGKEWDALRLLEHENAHDEFRSEWDDLWRAQTRHALRTAALIDTFLLRINEFSRVPDTADIRFMRIVGDYLGGSEITAVIGDMTGLSAPAEVLRRELLRQGSEKIPVDDKLRKLLTLFALNPEKIQLKEYRQLSTLLASYSVVSRETCEILEELFTSSRKLNSASAVKNREHGVTESDLIMLDCAMHKVLSGLPQPFSRVIVAPILTQVCIALRRVAEINPEKGARCALAAPFCMEKLVGSGWAELRKKFQLEVAQEFSVADLAGLQKTARDATFEERFLLVNKLVKIMSSQQDFDVNLQEILIILFKGIFKELTARRTKISDRDQRRLAVVFGPFFSKNIDFLYGSMEDLPFLLNSAASAGCLDAVSALLHTFFAVMVRDRAMLANARSMLKHLPLVQEKDVRDLFDIYREVAADDLKTLKGTLDICRECGHELDEHVARNLGLTLLSALVMNTLMGSGGPNSFMSMIMGPMSAESAQICKRLIKGMECFSGNPLFSAPVALARSFPSGRISGKEFGLYLEQQIVVASSTEQAIADFVLILESIRQAGEAQQRDMPFGDMLSCNELIKELLGAGLEVLCGKKELVMRHSTVSLTVLVDIVRKYGDGRGCERYMQLIGNTAADRGVSGDEVAAKLYENTIDYIVRATKPEKKKGRRR